MLANGLLLASVSVVGWYMLYKKLPRRVRKFLEKHGLLTDLIACILTYMFLGSTLTALFAAALVGVMVSMLLHIAANSEDFLYIFDFIEAFKAKLHSINQSLSEYGKKYKEERKSNA